MTDTEELERLAASITPGSWVRDCWDILGIGDGNGTGSVCCVSYPNGDDDQYWKDGEADDNARAIALVPDLLAEVIALRAEVKRLNGALKSALADSATAFLRATDAEARANAAEADAERLAAQLDIDRRLVSEAAMTGFRWEDGDWAERLFENNGQITAALAAHTQRVNAKEVE